MKEALTWFGVWLGLALVFNIGVVIFHERGFEAGLEFFAGYLVSAQVSVTRCGDRSDSRGSTSVA